MCFQSMQIWSFAANFPDSSREQRLEGNLTEKDLYRGMLENKKLRKLNWFTFLYSRQVWEIEVELNNENACRKGF